MIKLHGILQLIFEYQLRDTDPGSDRKKYDLYQSKLFLFQVFSSDRDIPLLSLKDFALIEGVYSILIYHLPIQTNLGENNI